MATVLSAAPGLLKIADAAGTRGFLAQLGAATPAQRQAQLLTQLRLLADTRLHGLTRLQVLEALREAVLETQNARSREYWGKPVPFDNDTREIFERSIALWRALADAYESLIADMAGAAPELAEEADTICYRALRFAGFAMSAHNRAYHAVPGALWEQLHRLYAFAESAGVTASPVNEGAGSSNVNLAYLQIVLSQRAGPDALSLLQMNTVDRLVAQWAALGSLSASPVLPDRDKALAVDLESAQGARRVCNLQGSNLRYLDIEKIGDKLRQTAVALKTQGPDKLGLGAVPRKACDELMPKLHTQWFAPGSGRGDERKTAPFNVLMSSTLEAMHYNISGKPFAPPDAGLSSRERFDMAGFQRVDGPGVVGEASVRSRTLETWTVVNQSSSGILGKSNSPSNSTRLMHNQLLGLVSPNGRTYLGLAQRLVVEADGATWLGFRVLRVKARAAAAKKSGNNATYDRALLLDADGGDAPSIVVSPGTYAPGGTLELHDGKPRYIRLTALIDSGANFERASYTDA